MALENYQWLKERLFKEGHTAIDKAELIKPIADELGCTRAQLAIAWCAANKHVSSVILGATTMEQIEENLKSLEVIPKLTPEIMDRLDEILESKPKL